MAQIQNPILKGFNPDPSIVRVGEEYYIAVSTFEWFPGITVYRSRNLRDWEFAAAPLNDDQKLDLRGIDTACGIWAPNLTYDNGRFYLIYTIVYTNRSRFKDTHNFLVTAEHIEGPWSDPVFLNCSGFDPSLFHDGDRKWLVNMTIDHRMDRARFSGVDIQEYDEMGNCLKGPVYRIFRGSPIGKTEGPNMMKRGGYYYLICAEGGTEFGHCVTVARSRNITGPYEVHPQNPMLTSKADDDYPIQRAGHGQLVQTADGSWYMAHLCSRPVDGCSILGRETALQNIRWTEDGWFCLAGGGRLPFGEAKMDAELELLTKAENASDKVEKQGTVLCASGNMAEDFNSPSLPWQFLTLRESAAHCGLDLNSRPGWLRIHGGNSLSSKYRQAFTARRQQAFSYDAVTKVDFCPGDYHHMAGLVCYYNYDNYFYLKITRDEELGRCIQITSVINREVEDSPCVSVPDKGDLYLKAKVRRGELTFFYSTDGENYEAAGNVLDMHGLSDERVNGNGFAGAMVGIGCQDLQGNGVWADFDWFLYEEI